MSYRTRRSSFVNPEPGRNAPPPRRTSWWLLLCLVVICALSGAVASRYSLQFGSVEHEVTSDYSHIRIRTQGNVRTMLFVRDTGEEVVESQLDLQNPEQLRVAYTQYMFLNYLFDPRPEKVLIVGLGGGSMVHFLQHYDPEVQIDVVEIDPAVVSIAEDYFGVSSEGTVKIMTADGFDYLRTTEEKYDVIYMDAFLKPSDETDSTGAPLRLHSAPFYDAVKERLEPGGVVVFNLNTHRRLDDDLRTIRASFPQTYRFTVPNTGNVVVIGSPSEQRVPPRELMRSAQALDQRFAPGFSFRTLARRINR